MTIEEYCKNKEISVPTFKLALFLFENEDVKEMFISKVDFFNNIQLTLNSLRINVIDGFSSNFELRSEIKALIHNKESNNTDNTEFSKYISDIKNAGMTTSGYSSNLLSRAVIKENAITKRNYDSLKFKTKDFKLSILVKVTIQYYEEGTYKANLDKFLDEIASGYYQDYLLNEVKKTKTNYGEY